jgi:hypothetical protein
MVLPVLVVVLVALAFVLRTRGRRHTPDRLERVYLVAAALPLSLALAVPALVGVTMGFDAHSRPWIDRANAIGMGLSVGLLAIGVGLIVRAVRRGRAWGWPLGGAVLVAAAPAIIVAVTYAVLTLAGALAR